MEFTARQVEAADRRGEHVRSRTWTRGVKRALIVVCVFFIFQQITGINVPLYYGPKLLGPLFQSGSSKVASTVGGVEVTAIIAAVNVMATYFAFRWIDRIGRRKLAMGGYAGMAVASVLAAPGLLLFTGIPRIVIVMIALNAFIASFAIGVGGTGWLIQAFPAWQTGIGLGWIMICFAVLCLLAIGFVHRFVPETKNRSVEEITELFERQAEPGPPRVTGPRTRGATA